MSSVTLGKYRLIAELGRGGMAEVFLAVASSTAMSFAKLVVLKKLREHLADDDDFMTMLVDEARISARLNHPNLVQTIEVGEVNGQYFLTMEYLDGQPLHRILSRARETIPLNIHLSILIDVLEGIHYAHDLKDYDSTPLQIVHRDVTPHNCFVTYEGQVKVVDFGIAKAIGRASETRHGVIKGKTAYMAPEQAMGQHVDRRVDVFAVGVMLYEAATRQRLWKGVSETDIIRRLVRGNIPSSPKAIAPSVDDELDRICQKALKHLPDDRYATAQELLSDLEAYLRTKGGRPPARVIGQHIAELFADKRLTTHKIIESQLAHLRNDSVNSVKRMPPHSASSESLASPNRASRSGGAPKSRSIGSIPSSGRPPSSTAGKPPSTADRNEPVGKTLVMLPRTIRSRTKGLEPLIFAAIALTIATTVLTILSFPSSSNSTASKQIMITLRATPLETQFSIDDGPLEDNPYVGRVSSDGQKHRIRAVASGYAPQEERTTFSDDVSLRFNLTKK